MSLALSFEEAPVSAAGASAGLFGSGQYVTFSCADLGYAIDIMSVREIRSWAPITPLPSQPSAARGVLDIRGSVVQVFDLTALLGRRVHEERRGQVVLVVSLESHDVGLLVDSVSDIVFAEPSQLRAPPEPRHGPVSALIRADDRLIAILDPHQLLRA